MIDLKKKQEVASGSSRRTFLGWFLGIGTVGVAAALSVPLVQFALDPLTRTSTETEWSDLGPASDFAEVNVPQKRTISITQIDGWRKVITEKPLYVIKGADGNLSVLTAVCTHLGCSVKWIDTASNFKCPCHNGTFTPTGKYVSGPPPRDMDSLESRIVDGHLQVRYQSFRQLVKTKEVMA
jgi:menaquinol-cytochrome c reductase iron-sulfur subunit